MVVWDFDGTITKKHSCFFQKDFYIEEKLSSIVADPLVFRNLNLYLNKMGIQLGIASFGKRDIITSILDRIFEREKNPFLPKNIITPKVIAKRDDIRWEEGFEPPPRYNKVTMIQHLLSSYLDEGITFDNKEVLLIDDSLVNCAHAKDSAYRYIFLQGFNRDHGFNPLALENVKEMFKSISKDEFASIWTKFLDTYAQF